MLYVNGGGLGALGFAPAQHVTLARRRFDAYAGFSAGSILSARFLAATDRRAEMQSLVDTVVEMRDEYLTGKRAARIASNLVRLRSALTRREYRGFIVQLLGGEDASRTVAARVLRGAPWMALAVSGSCATQCEDGTLRETLVIYANSRGADFVARAVKTKRKSDRFDVRVVRIDGYEGFL